MALVNSDLNLLLVLDAGRSQRRMIGRKHGMYCDHQSTDVALAISVGLDVYVAFVVNVFITLLTLAKYSQVPSWLLSLRMLNSCRS